MGVPFFGVLGLYFNNIFLLKNIAKEVLNILIILLIHFNNEINI
jgi:hypothetical protein